MKKIKINQLGPVLKGLSELTGDDFSVVLQKLSIDAFRELIRRSAKDTGFLRSNWSLTISTPAEGILNNPSRTSHQAASPPTAQIKADDKVIIYNNTAYAMYLETGTPHMRAQPMIEPTYARVLSQAEKLSKEFTKRKYNV